MEGKTPYVSYSEISQYTGLGGQTDEAYIGTPLEQLGKRLNKPYAPSLKRFYFVFKGFDGTFYLAPRAIKLLHDEELMFASSNMFRYNQIVVRHRPSDTLRHVFLCYDSKTKGKAQEFEAMVNKLYPDVVKLMPFEYIYRIKTLECNKHESELCRSIQSSTSLEVEPGE